MQSPIEVVKSIFHHVDPLLIQDICTPLVTGHLWWLGRREKNDVENTQDPTAGPIWAAPTGLKRLYDFWNFTIELKTLLYHYQLVEAVVLQERIANTIF